MSDHAEKEQYPLSLLLDVFQSIQKKNIPFMLLFTGLPTLFPKLVESRTFAERMFNVTTLHKLPEKDSRDAINVPITQSKCPISFNEESILLIYKTSGGYPYFIQFICKEVFDIFVQQMKVDGNTKPVPIIEIVQKLDRNFFAGRWSRATDFCTRLNSPCPTRTVARDGLNHFTDVLPDPRRATKITAARNTYPQSQLSMLTS